MKFAFWIVKVILYYIFENFVYHLFSLNRHFFGRRYQSILQQFHLHANVLYHLIYPLIHKRASSTSMTTQYLFVDIILVHYWKNITVTTCNLISTAAGLLSFEIHVMSETIFFNCFSNNSVSNNVP